MTTCARCASSPRAEVWTEKKACAKTTRAKTPIRASLFLSIPWSRVAAGRHQLVRAGWRGADLDGGMAFDAAGLNRLEAIAHLLYLVLILEIRMQVNNLRYRCRTCFALTWFLCRHAAKRGGLFCQCGFCFPRHRA